MDVIVLAFRRRTALRPDLGGSIIMTKEAAHPGYTRGGEHVFSLEGRARTREPDNKGTRYIPIMTVTNRRQVTSQPQPTLPKTKMWPSNQEFPTTRTYVAYTFQISVSFPSTERKVVVENVHQRGRHQEGTGTVRTHEGKRSEWRALRLLLLRRMGFRDRWRFL